jgi:Sec-independent protein translocase protein TatA
MDFLGIGPWEILLILIVAVIFLGPGKIVDFARTLGKWVRAIRKTGNEFIAAVTREIDNASREPSPPAGDDKNKPETDSSDKGQP